MTTLVGLAQDCALAVYVADKPISAQKYRYSKGVEQPKDKSIHIPSSLDYSMG
jgi:hypothetical protein